MVLKKPRSKISRLGTENLVTASQVPLFLSVFISQPVLIMEPKTGWQNHLLLDLQASSIPIFLLERELLGTRFSRDAQLQATINKSCWNKAFVLYMKSPMASHGRTVAKTLCLERS
jgi:hypothetical protein